MEPLENPREGSPLSQNLSDALGKAELGDYTEALASLKSAKSFEPRNVYILAFEKQLEQLIEYKQRNMLSEEQRADIIESLPGIVERAIEGSALASHEPGAAQDQQPREKSAEERSAAFEWLKNQYFQHAHEHVRKGEYQNALAEIRRVYIIDPGNKVARDFERQVQEQARQHAGRPAAAAVQPPPAIKPPPPAPVHAPSPPVHTDDGEDIPIKTEEWSSPLPSSRAEAPRSVRLEEIPEEKDSSTLIVVMILITILIAIGAGFFFWGRQNAIQKSLKEPGGSNLSSPERSFASMAPVSERSFVVSSVGSEAGARAREVSNGSYSRPAGENGDQVAQAPPAAALSPSGSENDVRTTFARSQTGSDFSGGESQWNDANSSAARRFVPVEKSAEVVKLESPRFPDAVYARGLVGQVIVQVQIDTRGQPVKARVTKSTNPLLNDSVIDAVMRSTYLPGRISSGPVTSWLTIPFRFETNQ